MTRAPRLHAWQEDVRERWRLGLHPTPIWDLSLYPLASKLFRARTRRRSAALPRVRQLVNVLVAAFSAWAQLCLPSRFPTAPVQVDPFRWLLQHVDDVGV
ncbi:MAG: hypothetical protein RMM30_04315 [Armatimonadota bacterium]|nr:hypothetical protein [Armatimonadota bacterium]MDW8155792.1 hypothetical protein [Armatimonadota bacterium]